MFEGVIASLLNRYLGKYVENLDLERLNVGIFSGNVTLENLKLKSEALYELGLPITVKLGTIGKLSLNIPWNRLCNQTSVISIEEIFILVSSVTIGKYEQDIEKKLIRAEKKQILEKLDPSGSNDGPDNFIETLITSVLNNLKVHIHNVHIRYEDTVSNIHLPMSFGLCVYSISVETTNSKWKPISHSSKMGSVYQIVKIDSFSLYCNANCTALLLKNKNITTGSNSHWFNYMKRSLETFKLLEEPFDFLVRPISIRLKIIINKSNEARIPTLLVDFVLQDAALQLSHKQYHALLQLKKSFHRISRNRLYKKFHPDVPVSGNARKWWKYAYESVVKSKIEPFTWSNLFSHRKNCRTYCNIYKKLLLDSSNTELKLDLQKVEDNLDIYNIIIAREQTKMMLRKEFPDKIGLKEQPLKWWFRLPDNLNFKRYKLCVNDRKNGVWNLLSQNEKNSLCEVIGYAESDQSAPDTSKQYIEHKFNFTVANLNLTLISGGSETLVVTLTHVLSSIEVRPSAKAYKLSTRVGTLLIEGASVEYSLIPIITSENILDSNSGRNFLVLDFEKNPPNSEIDYSLSISSEALEIIYHEFSVSSFASFLQTPTLNMNLVINWIKNVFKNVISKIASNSVSRRYILQLNLDMKLPYIVIPEYGTLQKDGNIVVLDLGRIKLWSDLQLGNANLEDATQLELEEKLYDRFYFSLTDFQILMFNHGHAWRNFKKINSSQHHVLSKVHSQVVFSNSIKPENKQLPRYKLNMSLQKLKISMSDSRIVNLLNFYNNLPLPKSHTILDAIEDDSFNDVEAPNILKILESIQYSFVCLEVRNQSSKLNIYNKETRKSFLSAERSCLLSDVSDEDSEIWARILELLGFDDYVSQNNVIIYLLRIHILQVTIELKRNCNNIDKPFIIIQLKNLCCDTAFMEYGPAVQISLRSINVLDKLHGTTTSNTTTLFSTEGKPEVLTILYRKIRSDCPDFKSHFHSVEQSLVVDVNKIQVTFHREAFIDLYRFMKYFSNKFKNCTMLHTSFFERNSILQLYSKLFKTLDPPIPPGATKFSYSVRLSNIKFQLCDNETDFLSVRIGGFELDNMFKANEKFVFKMYLMTIIIEDISNTSLYPKILNVEEEKLIEIKYIRHSPRLSKTNIEYSQNDVESDGTLKFHFGRVHFVLMFKLISNTQKFLYPFISVGMVSYAMEMVERWCSWLCSYLRFCTDKIHVSIDLQLPTFLLPQQASSPNLIVFNAGDLTVENFFKELCSEERNQKTFSVINNTLIKLDNVSVSRAIVNFNGSIIVQETIMEPVCCKVDTKQMLSSSQITKELDSLSMLDINMSLDKIKINLGQKDFNTLNLVRRDNIMKIINIYRTSNVKYSKSKEEAEILRLEAFFYQSGNTGNRNTLLANLEGIDVSLYTDIDEIFSSPLRDETRSLCKLKIGEIIVHGLHYANGRNEIQLSVQSLLLEDTREIKSAYTKKIFQSYGATNTQSNNENVSVTVPPVISITVCKNHVDESRCDILIDHTRLNLGVSFLVELTRFFGEGIPCEQETPKIGGVVNYGYLSENTESNDRTGNNGHVKYSNNAGNYSSFLLSEEGFSLSISCRKPEIMFFSQTEDYPKNHALLLRSDLSIEYIRHSSNVSFICNITDLHMLSKLQSTLVKTPSNVILQPCNIIISKNWISINEETKISVTCNAIDVHMSASTVHTVLGIIQELDTHSFVQPNQNRYDSSKNMNQEMDNLWTPKTITPYCLPQKHESFTEYTDLRISTEIMVISLPIMILMFEIEDIVQKKSVLLLKSHAEAKVKNWSNSLEIKGEISLQCSYFNFNLNTWEPVIEPSFKTDDVYRPWEFSIKAFKSKSYPISTILGHIGNKNFDSKKKSSVSSVKLPVKSSVDSGTSTDEENSNESVKTVRKRSSFVSQTNMNADRINYEYSDTESESDNEDAVMEKLKSKFGQLLTGESSDDNNDSDSDISMNEEQSCDNQSDDTSDTDTISHATCNSFLLEKKAIFITRQKESIDPDLDAENYKKAATYIILESSERFELVFTPSTISVLQQILDSFSIKFNNINTDAQFLSLKNDIAPGSTVILLSKSTIGSMKVLMRANYTLFESSASSPSSTVGSPCEINDHSDSEFNSGIENFEGGFAPDAYSISDTARKRSDENILLNAIQFPHVSVDDLYNKIIDQQLQIRVPGFEELTVISPTRTIHKCHALHPIKNNTRYYIIISIQNDLWGHSITVRSPLQMKNETCFALSLYYKKSDLDKTDFEYIGELTNPFKDMYKFAIIEPDVLYNVPLMITYHCPIYVIPIYQDYQLSESFLWWKELANDIGTAKDVACKPKNEKLPIFFIRALTTEGVNLSNPCSRGIPNLLIRFLPPVVIYNLLPCAFQIKIPSADVTVRIEAGGKSSVYSIDMTIKQTVHIEVPVYFGITWNGTFNLCDKLEEKLISTTTEQDTDGGNKHLSLNVKIEKVESFNVMIYAPYWIVNKTGLPLQLRGSSSDIVHDTFAEEPLFFSFRKTQKRRIRLRIYQSSWSSAFSIDTAGCAKQIICRDRERNRNYHILVEISLSQLSPQLTKVVTLLPYFLLLNECILSIRCMEENEQADLWIDLPQNQTTPYWPETNSMKIYVKLRDSSLVSQHFFINQACQTVLRMDKGTALVVDIVGGNNNPFLIVFRNYKYGDAPIRVDNYCEDLFLKISQECLGQVTLLSPYQSLLYTWDDPTIERELQWNAYNSKNRGFTANFKTDGYGQEFVSFKLVNQHHLKNTSSVKDNKLSSSFKKLAKKYREENNSSIEESDQENAFQMKTHKGKVVVYWVSYLEGPQRVLLLTQDEQLAYHAYSRIDSEKSNTELFLALKGIGISLVTSYNNMCRELAYVSINDSSSIWEVNVAHSWKILPLELATWIEHQWSQGIKKAQLKDYVYVDLEKMQLKKPIFGELKRRYNPAIWIHSRKSFNYYYIQWKIHKFQIDNQLPNSVFQSILYPKTVPYDVIRKYGLKPFIEGTVLKKRDTNYHDKNIYKYIKFNILEFCVQLDKQFILSLNELIQPWIRAESSSLKIRADICKVHHPLTIKFNNNLKNRRQTVIEYLYFSPVRIQFSFTPQNIQHFNYNLCTQKNAKTYLQFIINCIHTTFVDLKGIKLKCPYFEEFGILTHLPSKLHQIGNDYFSTLIQQIYFHMLGIDTLNNTNCEIDFSEEYVELYYDLTMIFLKKIDEFAEAISESAQCLLSYITTSSVNSNSSLIMCGKRTSLDLGLNPELIKKKFISNRSSYQEPEQVLRGNYCFEVYVLYGLSGFCMNSPKCTYQGGMELFFRTVGKHLFRLFNKYSNTVPNTPTAMIDGIRRAAETGVDITFRTRLPKYVNHFSMRPYSVHHSIGLNILNSIKKGIYAETDVYWTHIILTNDGKSCLLITLQRIFFIVKLGLWDDWKIEWCVEVNDIIEVPQVLNNKLVFKIHQEETVHNFYSDDIFIEHTDVNLLFWIQKMIEIVFIINLENKPCCFVESQVSRT